MRIILALAACLALAGCFISDAPLYAENEGACPVRSETQYAIPQVDAGGAFAEFPTFTLAPDGRHCLRTNHAMPGEPPVRALFVPFEDGWYIMQREQQDGGSGAGYLYQLARFDGDRADIYMPSCADFTAAALTELGVEPVEMPVGETPPPRSEGPPIPPLRTKHVASGAKQAPSMPAMLCRVNDRAQLENVLRRWISLRRPPSEYGARTN